MKGGGVDGLDGAILGQVDFVLAVILDVGVSDLSLHGVEIVEVGAESEQFINI